MSIAALNQSRCNISRCGIAGLLWLMKLKGEPIRLVLDKLDKYLCSAGISGLRNNLTFAVDDKARGPVLSAHPLRLSYKRRIQEGHFIKICVGHFMDQLFEIELQGVAPGHARVWPTRSDA